MTFFRDSRAELPLAAAALFVLTVGLTYPLSLHPASVAYLDAPDAQFSIWNVAWVAHALLTDPAHLFDANIFYPHTGTLFYSEANLAAGMLATPVYWLTGNPFAAHNLAVFSAFLLAAIGMFSLVHYLSGDWRAAMVSAVCFAFCPHVYSHLHHIQLLMTAGLPFSLLAFHRLADRPTWRRGALLGLVMAAQAYACAYYAVFDMLTIGVAVLVIAATRPSGRSAGYAGALVIAAAIAIVCAAPLASQYLALHETTGFARPLVEADRYAADWRAYFASAAYAHRWMLPFLGRWNEVLFPGGVSTIFGLAGLIVLWRSKREIVILYGGIAALSLWASFGPAAGLYRLLYALVPGFTFLRAPSRFGLLVALALSVLAGLGLATLLRRTSRPWLMAAAALLLAVTESIQPLRIPSVPAAAPGYQRLAQLPRGPLLELPVYSNRFAFMRARYMLASTIHWQPLVNGYSDYIPPDFIAREGLLGEFPTEASLAWLNAQQVRYAMFHVDDYPADQRRQLEAKLAQFAGRLRRLDSSDGMWLYELVGEP